MFAVYLRCLAFCCCPLAVAAQTVTFNKEVAPIFFEQCAPCHHSSDAAPAPFSLVTYAEVRSHASTVVQAVQERYMPPWLPEAGYGDFSGERRLTSRQIQLISSWVKNGAPEGVAADLPPTPKFNDGWQLGTPDLVVKLPVAYRIPASGSDIFRNFVLPVNITGTRYVRALELKPGNKSLVHHANIWIDRRRTLRNRDGEDGKPGFPGMESKTLEARSDTFDPDSHFLFWKPGTVAEFEPDDMSWRLDPETDLILNLHLQPSGKEELVQPTLGLYFGSTPPRRFPMVVQLENDGALDIPPGSRDFSVSDHLTLPSDVEVLAIYPHAHYLGKQIEAWASLPDGRTVWLLKINNWDMDWQAVFRYKQPVPLPKGATIQMRISYDNSGSNPRNPHHPPERVRAGPRSQDEMGHVWLQVLPKKNGSDDPRIGLQEAVMTRRLEKYPQDFAAFCNLGALDAAAGLYRQAASYFERAVQVQPASATARNGLGAALLAQGLTSDAERELREALRLDPNHLNTHTNLAKILWAKRDFSGAGAELHFVAERRPENADAQFGAGLAYAMSGRYNDALPHLRAAARLRPNDADVQTNLGVTLANLGDLEAAKGAFEQALRLKPDDTVAREYLAKANAALASQRH